MKKQVVEALENARANLDLAIAGLETITEIDDETVGYTAHKLNNYLTVVGATAELLEVYLAGHPDDQVQIWIEGLQHAVHLMKHDIGRLMFSANGAEPKFKLEKVDLALLAFRACNFYRHKAAWKKIQVNSELQPDCCFAWTDRVAVAVVLDNLLSNALKFSENGKQIWVQVRCTRSGTISSARCAMRGPASAWKTRPGCFKRASGCRIPRRTASRPWGTGWSSLRTWWKNSAGAFGAKAIRGAA